MFEAILTPREALTVEKDNLKYLIEEPMNMTRDIQRIKEMLLQGVVGRLSCGRPAETEMIHGGLQKRQARIVDRGLQPSHV
jgi:hypothetical protein